MERLLESAFATASITLEADHHAPGRARAELDALAGGLLDGERLADARLLLTELVTNGVLHGQGPMRIDVRAGPGVLHAEVVDQGDGFHERVADPDRQGGWGLGIVDALADRWGVYSGSTHVWFELGRPLSG